jgi:porin
MDRGFPSKRHWGVVEKFSYPGLLDFGVEIDTEKACLWQGGTLFVSSFLTYGRDAAHDSGTFANPSSIAAYDTIRLFEAWYEQRLFGDKLSIRAGQIALDSEFATSDMAAELMINNFGYQGIVSAFDGHSQFGVAGLGVRVLLEPQFSALPGAYLMAAVSEGNPDGAADADGGPLNNTGVRYDFQFGVAGSFELGYRLDADHGWEGLPGIYKAGFFYHTDGNQRPPLVDLAGNAHEDNQVFYVRGDQMVWAEEGQEDQEGQGLGVFAQYSYAPGAVNNQSWEAGGGVAYYGLLPTRDRDRALLGVLVTNNSELFRQCTVDASGNFHDGCEYAFEATYIIQMAPWWTVQPDVQYIVNPSGGVLRSDGSFARDVVILGLRTTLSF